MESDRNLTNHEIVTLAVYILGGDSHRIDIEDIAVQANKLAPGRFTWRKYPDQINIELIRAFLSDAKKVKNGCYLAGSGNEGWFLTATGLAFAKKSRRSLKVLELGRKAVSPKVRMWMKRERERMLSTDAYAKFSAGKKEDITDQEAESFFRIDAYVTGKAREHKLMRAKNSFSDDHDLGSLVKYLDERLLRRTSQ